MKKTLATLAIALLGLVPLRAQLVSTQNVNGYNISTITFGDNIYAITSALFAANADWNAAVKSEFGSSATVASFNTLKSDASPGANGTALYDWMVATQKTAVNVTYNGNQMFSPSSPYSWFIQAFAARPGPGWAVFNTIYTSTSAEIELGRWNGNRSILALVTPSSSTAAVPEPSTYALFGLGVIGLVIAVRRRRVA